MTVLQSTWRMADDQPVLVGSRCSACGAVQFPVRAVCPHCGPGTEWTETQLSRRGKLYAFTQLHQSKPHFPTPYFMGYVDLPDGVRVPARIACDVPPQCQVEVDLDMGIVGVDAAGEPVISYVFRPSNSGSAAAQQ